MATYISRQTGDYTATTTWYTADTATSSQQITGTATTNSTTSYSYSSTFTGTNTKVADGIMLFCFRTSTTGTVTVALSDDNGTTATREVTLNCSDIPEYPTWIFFKFGSTLTLDGGTDYRVGVKTSTNATITFYRDATAANWNRLVRIQDAAATLTTGDITYTVGEWTAANTFTPITVTINVTSGTTPTSTTNMGNLEVGSKGLLKFSTAGSSTFQIQLQGNLRVFADGEFNMGTSGDRIPSTSTATLFFNSGSSGQYGITVLNGGIFRAYGQRPSFFRTKLNADASAAATAMTTADSTGWVNGDVIGIAATQRSSGQSETRTVNSTSGTTLNITAGLTNAHAGSNADRKADIILLTRNAKIRGNTTTNTSYIYAIDKAILELDSVQIFNFGNNASGSSTVPWTTPGKRGIEVESSLTGSTKLLTYCSGQDFSSFCALLLVGTNTTNFSNIEVSNCVGYSLYYQFHLINTPTDSASEYTMTDCSFMNGTFGILVQGTNTSISGTRISGMSSSGLRIDNISLTNANTISNVSITNCEVYSSGGSVECTASFRGLYFNNCIIWRNTSNGVSFSTLAEFVIFDSCKFLDNATTNVSIASDTGSYVFKNCSFDSFSGFTTANGINFASSVDCEVKLFNCTFGSNLGHTTADLTWASATNVTTTRVIMVSCTLSSATKFSTETTGMSFQSFVKSTNDGNNSNVHFTRYAYGRIESDTSKFRTALPSEAIYPTNVPNSNSAFRLESSKKLVPVASGSTVTVSVYVRKSVIGDGTAYNGNQPRLMLRQNNKLGITSDTVIDTSTASGDGAWEELTGTTAAASDNGIFEFYIDCTGTAGQVNIDDWSVT